MSQGIFSLDLGDDCSSSHGSPCEKKTIESGRFVVSDTNMLDDDDTVIHNSSNLATELSDASTHVSGRFLVKDMAEPSSPKHASRFDIRDLPDQELIITPSQSNPNSSLGVSLSPPPSSPSSSQHTCVSESEPTRFIGSTKMKSVLDDPIILMNALHTTVSKLVLQRDQLYAENLRLRTENEALKKDLL